MPPAVLLLARWADGVDATAASTGIGTVFAAGFVGGALTAIRYVEVLFLPAILVFACLAAGGRRRRWRGCLAAAAGAAVPLTALLARDYLAYGALWPTQYGLANGADAFGASRLVEQAPALLGQMLTTGPGVMLPLGIAGIWMWARRPATRARAWLLAGLIVPITLVLMSFHRPPDGQSVRFFLPAFPLYAVGAAAALQGLRSRHPRTGIAVAAATLALAAASGLPPSRLMLSVHRDHNAVLAGMTDFLAARVPRDSVIVTGTGVAQQLDFVGGWKLADPTLVLPEGTPAGQVTAPGGRAPDAGRGPEARRRHYGQDRPGDRYRALADDVVTWAAGREMYLFGKAAELRPWWNYLKRGDSLDLVAEYPVPDEPPEAGAYPPLPPRPRLATGLPIEPAGEAPQPAPWPSANPPANRIFDLVLDGRPLVLLRWTRR